MNLTRREVVPSGHGPFATKRSRYLHRLESGRAGEADGAFCPRSRWMEEVNEFTGGDPGIERSLGNIWRREENIHGIDTGAMREMMG